jgi:hypothetical protein
MKNRIMLISLSILLALSLVYIICDIWGDFKNNQMAKAYQQGKVDTINTLITAVEKSCDPVSVSSTDKQIGVIDASCLKAGTSK